MPENGMFGASKEDQELIEQFKARMPTETQEEKQVREYMEAQQAAVNTPPAPPEIPQFLEVPRPKDWSTFGSYQGPVDGVPNDNIGQEMQKILNPAWVKMQENKAVAAEAPIQSAGKSIDPSLTDLARVEETLDCRIVSHQRNADGTITVTLGAK